jgi:hypothetical protein
MYNENIGTLIYGFTPLWGSELHNYTPRAAAQNALGNYCGGEHDHSLSARRK